jgi:hypothetical protein
VVLHGLLIIFSINAWRVMRPIGPYVHYWS